MSTGCKSSHNGFLDVSRSNGGLSISGCIGQLSCSTIFSTSLSVAAFLRRAGSSMLESTGSNAVTVLDDRMSTGRLFHTSGLATVNARLRNLTCILGTRRSPRAVERSDRRVDMVVIWW